MPDLTEPITIKGTRYGLLIAVREDADLRQALEHLQLRVERDQGFLKGATLSVDFGWRAVDLDEMHLLETVFHDCGLALAGVISTNLQTRTVAESRGHKAIIGRLGLAQHHGRQLKRESLAAVTASVKEAQAESVVVSPDSAVMEQAVALVTPPSNSALPAVLQVAQLEPPIIKPAATSPLFDDREQEDTLYIKRTLRSGQRALYAGHVVVMGDVNPGAEIEADGDVVVIGQLRGRVHAGASGNAEAQIWSLAMQPTMLLIADQVWSAETRTSKKTKPVPACRAVLRGGEIQFETASLR